MSRPRFLLVGVTEQIGRRAANILGLDPNDWKVVGLGAGLAGSRFEKIVVLVDRDDPRLGLGYALDWLNQIRCRLPPDYADEFYFI